jgi:DNA-binding transcriptional LysR family regulator
MHIQDFDLNLLHVFQAVHGARNVSRAAEVLGLSQPAVSQGLTRLRLVMKDALFVRAGRGVAPTPKADALAHAVQQALHLVGEALHSAAQFDPATARRTFRLHMSDIGESEFLPGLMHEVRRLAPDVGIETRQLEYGQIENALDSGTIDAAFGYLPGVEHTRQQRLFMERYVVLARADHPLARDRDIPFAALAREPFLMRETGSGTRRAALNAFARHGFTPKARMELNSNEAIRESILAGLGVSILPRYTLGLEPEPPGLACLDVQGFPIESHWHFAWPVGKHLSAAARAFVEFARNEARVLAREGLARPAPSAVRP